MARSTVGDGIEDATGGGRDALMTSGFFLFPFAFTLLFFCFHLNLYGASKRWRFRRKDKPTHAALFLLY